MVRIENLPEGERDHLANLPCPEYDTSPWVSGPPLNQRRVALISTAGLHLRTDRPFTGFSGEYRVIPGDVKAGDLIMSHVSVNFDRTGFFQDWNMAFPLDRLREMAEQQVIQSVADYHYSFMGASDPSQMESPARGLARKLKDDRVNAVLLVPV